MNVSLEVDAPAGAASGNHLAVRRRRCFVAVQTFPADTSAVFVLRNPERRDRRTWWYGAEINNSKHCCAGANETYL